MMNTATLDPRIGMLGNGQFYAFVNGYDRPETVGTLAGVEAALGIRSEETERPKNKLLSWNVVMRFEHPAWDEVDGIAFDEIHAASKAEANKKARAQAERDGHAIGGRGRYTFTATKN